MKNILRTAVLAVALIFATAPVMAQDFEIKPYAGVGIGAFMLDVEDSTPGDPFATDDTVFGGFLAVGADVHEYLGLELRVGTTSDGSESIIVPGVGTVAVDYGPSYFISYLAKVQYPATPELRIYGLIGGTTAKVETSFTAMGFPVVTDSQTETGVSFGAGVDYTVMDNVSVGAEWVRYWHNVNFDATTEVDIDGISATVKYEF